MTKKTKVVLWSLIIALIATVVIILRPYVQAQREAELKDMYLKQNFAFRTGGGNSWNYYGHKDSYLGYDTILYENELYASLILYEYDTGNIVTLDDVQDYLSREYEEDGSVRRSSSYPEIQGYIDYMWQLYEESEQYYSSHSGDERRKNARTKYYKLPKISKFEYGFSIYGQYYLAVPYCIGFQVGTAGEHNITYIGYNETNLPKEQVDKLVDWILTSGYMDMSNRDEWFAEHPPTIPVMGYVWWRQAVASGVKPVDEIPDETWEEWVEQYNEAMAKASS